MKEINRKNKDLDFIIPPFWCNFAKKIELSTTIFYGRIHCFGS